MIKQDDGDTSPIPPFRALGNRSHGPSKALETFPTPQNITEVKFTSDELTSFCPVTEQPDFNKLVLIYHPNQRCVESKSLKLYLWSFREERLFGETLAHTIVEDLFQALQPRYCRVELQQGVRGGMQLTAIAEKSETTEER